MQEVMIGLQFSVLIPILVYLVYRPKLNTFFMLLLASLFLSAAFDVFGTVITFYSKNNIAIYFTYFIINSVLIIFMWQKVPFYNNSAKRYVRICGYSIVFLLILVALYYKMTIETFYIAACLSVFMKLIFAMQYYYNKINLSSYTPILQDPYFIVASGFILFSLSTIIILAVQIQYANDPLMSITWVLRQTFYLIFNIIIAYAFYILSSVQKSRK